MQAVIVSRSGLLCLGFGFRPPAQSFWQALKKPFCIYSQVAPLLVKKDGAFLGLARF